MTYRLDLDDIQGNVVRAYGKYSFPFARYIFLNISHPVEGRRFVGRLIADITTAARWGKDHKPLSTLNMGFTFFGLYNLQLPTRVLQAMPEEFVDGMKARAFLLGDRDQTMTEAEAGDWYEHWDEIWRNNRVGDGYDANNVHIWISINAQMDPASATAEQPAPVPDLEAMTQTLRRYCDESNGGVRILPGNGRASPSEYQEAQAVFDKWEDGKGGHVWVPSPREHFGFVDGIGDPVFAGQLPEELEKRQVIGRGKIMDKGWQPLNPGEFILGHPDESQELPPAAKPPEFMRNCSFMAFRKLHENVATFHAMIRREAERFARVQDIPVEDAVDTLKAKMVGRWHDGIPLAHAPTHADWMKVRKDHGFDDPDPQTAYKNQLAYLASQKSSDFRYADDMKGYKTPPGAHMRRVNTRDYLDPLNKLEGDNPQATTALNKRRRIMRRGLPYGTTFPQEKTDDTEQGVTMMLVCASLSRQFEFVQQQWIQYGLDFHQGNDTCPLLGNHGTHKRMAIPARPGDGSYPYTMSQLETVVECRGGDYFFIPSITALRQIAMGVVDPT